MIRNQTKPVSVISRKVFYVLIAIALVALVLMAKAGAAETKPEEKKEAVTTPTLTAEEKLQIREFQLKDSRLLNEIQKRQIELNQLQAAGQENIQNFNAYLKGVCKPVGDKKFDLDLNSLSCTVQAVPATTTTSK